MTLREYIESQIIACREKMEAEQYSARAICFYQDAIGLMESLLAEYDAAHPPVTLETLPGELEKLGLKHNPERGTYTNGLITVYAAPLGIRYAVSQDSKHIANFTNPADALELVKLLVKGAEGQ